MCCVWFCGLGVCVVGGVLWCVFVLVDCFLLLLGKLEDYSF